MADNTDPAVQAVWDAAWALSDPAPDGQHWRRSKALNDALDALIARVRAEQTPPHTPYRCSECGRQMATYAVCRDCMIG